MNVSHPHSFVYWGIPHTGNNAISAALARHYGLENPEPNVQPNQIIIPDECPNYILIASIRNPFSRLVSYWEQFKNQKIASLSETELQDLGVVAQYKHRKTLEIQELVEKHPNDFAVFVNFIFEANDDKASIEIIPSQMAFLKHYVCNYYIRYETLDRDFSGLPFVGELVKVGLRSNSNHWKKLYTPKLQRVVAKHWEQDFTRLGYEMEIN